MSARPSPRDPRPSSPAGPLPSSPRVAPPTWWVPPAAQAAWSGLPLKNLYSGAPGDPVCFRFPEAGLAEFEELLLRLRAAGERLGRRPHAEVTAALATAARRLGDPAEGRRAVALELLSSVTGRARAMCEESLDFLLSKLTERALADTLRAATAEPACLARAAPHPAGRRRRAVGPRLTVHLLAGNTPWAGVESLVAALCARSASLVKLSSREPALAGLFAQALAEVDAELGEAMAVLHWPGGSEALEEAAFEEADAVVAFGDNATVGALGRRVGWRVAAGRLTFVPRGHRTAVALVGAGARASRESARRAAEALARDFALEDQEGCLSPHGAYVEMGGAETSPAETSRAESGGVPPGAAGPQPAVSLDAFAELVAEALGERERAWPRRELSAGEAAAVHQARGAAEMRGARVLAPEGSTRWTVVLDPRPQFEPTPLERFAWLKPVAGVENALAALAPARGLLAAVGVTGFGARRAECVERIAEVLVPGRVCAVGEMQRPPAGWSHDGASDLAALLRWVEVEG
jgi:hypothetical protein